MGLRPATPGFIVTLVATILLAVVSFNTPLLKSVFFLKATLNVNNVNGTITLGTLGYCIDLSNNGTTCSKPSVGYQFDANALLGDNVSFAQIPTVVVKWITYALFLHVIALCAAAASAFFGLLAHVREMSMTCCSSCISGLAAVITLVAFIFDVVLFFLVKERVKGINGTATFGTAVWLTLAAWILLFFSGCIYACGRCCISRRSRDAQRDGRMDKGWMGGFGSNANNTGGGAGGGGYVEQMRLDAIKAEADRKARQKNEIGLPAFPEHDATQPLNGTKPQYLEDDSDEDAGAGAPYRDQGARRQGSGAQTYRGGYAQAPPGTRAMDEYYSPTTTTSASTNMGYPPNRQYAATTSAGSRSPPPSTYAPSVHSSAAGAGAAGVGAGAAATAAYLAVGGRQGHTQSPSGREYGHGAAGTTFHTAASSQHQQYPSAYSQYNDPYGQHAQSQQAFNADSYNQTAAVGVAVPMASPYGMTSSPAPSRPLRQASQTAQYYAQGAGSSPSPAPAQAAYGNYNTYGAGAPQQQQQHQPERSYTLGGGGYGGNVVPDNSAAYGAGAVRGSPPPMPVPSASTLTNAGAQQRMASPVGAGYAAGGAMPQPQPHTQYEDSPPGYEAGPSVQAAEWDTKGQGFHVDSR